jgi:hypothetical protein
MHHNNISRLPPRGSWGWAVENHLLFGKKVPSCTNVTTCCPELPFGDRMTQNSYNRSESMREACPMTSLTWSKHNLDFWWLFFFCHPFRKFGSKSQKKNSPTKNFFSPIMMRWTEIASKRVQIDTLSTPMPFGSQSELTGPKNPNLKNHPKPGFWRENRKKSIFLFLVYLWWNKRF